MKKTVTLKESLLLAVIMTLISTLLVSILGSLFGTTLAVKLSASLISLVYILYLFSRSQSKTGQIAIAGIWAILTILGILAINSLPVFIGLQVISIWLIRSLFYYNSVISALGDLLLFGISFLTAVWAWEMTHSLLASFWSLYLVQALFVLIPEQFHTQATDRKSPRQHTRDPFEQAHQAAETALKQWASRY